MDLSDQIHHFLASISLQQLIDRRDQQQGSERPEDSLLDRIPVVEDRASFN